jgi:DNA-directed RNA polymerase specialized sigma24 family protein
MGLTRADYARLLATARRYRLGAGEAEDILQDALIEAVRAERHDVGRLDNRRWLVGVIRNKARMAARGSQRRILRETDWSTAPVEPAGEPPEGLPALPPTLRVVAVLALSGHSRREIAYLLNLEDAALRQRITQLKARLRHAGVRMPANLPGLNLDLAYGRIRDALLPLLLRQAGAIASHDPDGHLFVLKALPAKISSPRSQKP